jgi:UV DNA damage endonuclease
MVRISSDLLPVYTQSDWSYFWRKPDVVGYCEQAFGQVGQLARMADVRLSFHPGQFCCIVSDNDDVVHRSLEELEYHTDMIGGWAMVALFKILNVMYTLQVVGCYGHR